MANLRFAELTAMQAALRTEYDSEFNKRLAKNIQHHPLIRTSIGQARCQLCGSHDSGVPTRIEQRLHAEICPICGTKLRKVGKPKSLGRLKELDKKLMATAKSVNEAIRKIDRLKVQANEASERRDNAVEALQQFSSKHRKEISRLQATGKSDIQLVLEAYRQQIDSLEEGETSKVQGA